MAAVRFPLRDVRQLIVGIARDIHDGTGLDNEEAFRIVGTGSAQDGTSDIRGRVGLVQNTLNPNIFGANALLENIPLEINGQIGIVDFTVAINEVQNNPMIAPDQIAIESISANLFDNFSGERLRQEIANQWNQYVLLGNIAIQRG